MKRRVRFDLEPDENGYPPVAAEYLWCTELSQGAYRVENIPFYVRDVSLEDDVAVREESGDIIFDSVIHKSPNTTIRISLHDLTDLSALLQRLEALGCDVEQSDIKRLLAVSVSSLAETAEVLAILDAEAERGRLDFEESSVRYR